MKLLLALFITLLVGCDLFTEDSEVLFVFTEIQCVEYSWEGDIDDEVWGENVKSYLESEGITVNRLEALRDSLDHCAACVVCATGRIIRVWINTGDAILMDDLGFVEG